MDTFTKMIILHVIITMLILAFHSHTTKIQNKIHLFKPNHQFAKNCIRYDIATVINSTPNNIIAKLYTHSLQGLSGYIKQHFLQSYQKSCTIINCYICS